ncbi:2OG-Fe(II) oxygenase family protein [Marinimicrobium alkaliphilum]|uniref:2OG-Fe(II) oxygenase family protein n=1 Tax=Marinimicrobium alkaliphilum TaxID=2202654 RepID=UPI000DBA3C23|nr:2OG-Fe(II) oxygenase family protein [Marinimicrobium alkaliphilum]
MNDKMHLMELFPIPVFIFKTTQVDNDHLCKMVYRIRDEEISSGRGDKVGLSNLGGFRTYDIARTPGFEQLRAHIVSTVNAQILDGKWYPGGPIDESYIVGMWSVINNRGHANSVHNHPNAWFSGVYYAKVPDDNQKAGSICFRDPILARTYSRSFYRSSQSEICCLPPEEGLMVIFPGWFEHSVRPNQTDDDRVAISFNIKPHPDPALQ